MWRMVRACMTWQIQPDRSGFETKIYISQTAAPINDATVAIIIIIIIKKDWQCMAGRGRLPPYQSEDPSPTVPTYRGKKRKGNQLETKK